MGNNGKLGSVLMMRGSSKKFLSARKISLDSPELIPRAHLPALAPHSSMPWDLHLHLSAQHRVRQPRRHLPLTSSQACPGSRSVHPLTRETVLHPAPCPSTSRSSSNSYVIVELPQTADADQNLVWSISSQPRTFQEQHDISHVS